MSDDPKTEERRRRRLNTLGENLKHGRYDAAKKAVIASYYISLEALAQKIEEKTGRCTRTANKRIKCLFKMIGYEIKNIPEKLVDEIIELYEQSEGYKTIIYMCEDETPADIWSMIKNEQTIKNIYNTYLIAKQIILIESNNKKDYDEKISSLRYDKRLKAIYAAAKELI